MWKRLKLYWNTPRTIAILESALRNIDETELTNRLADYIRNRGFTQKSVNDFCRLHQLPAESWILKVYSNGTYGLKRTELFPKLPIVYRDDKCWVAKAYQLPELRQQFSIPNWFIRRGDY